MSELKKANTRTTTGNLAADAIRSGRGTALIGAAFLMATSAVGPGFLNNTVTFTKAYMGAMFFLILLSAVLEFAIHQNVWRTVCWTGRRGPEIANDYKKGFGYILVTLMISTSFSANMGNVGGVALSFQALFGDINITLATLMGGGIALLLYLVKNFKTAMDKATTFLGALMIIACIFVMYQCAPPVANISADLKSIPFDNIFMPLLALVGQSCGAYMTLAGPHRLLDADIKGKENDQIVAKAAFMGTSVTLVIRLLLFLCAFGVLSTASGIAGYDASNPAASVFNAGAGRIGAILFGVVLFSASATSVVGCSFTSISILKCVHPVFEKHERSCTIIWIVASTLIMAFIGRPATMLVVFAVLQGLILPFIMIIMMLVSGSKRIMGSDYHHPKYLTVLGWICVVLTGYAAFMAVIGV